MMLKSFLLLGFYFFLACSTPGILDEQPQTPSAAEMRIYMNNFIDAAQPNRGVGQAGHDKAFSWLKKQFDLIAQNSRSVVYVQEFLPDVNFAVKSYQNDFDTQVKNKFPSQSEEYKKWDLFTQGAISFVKKYAAVKGRNLILEFPGSKNPDHVLTIGAHYDTITHDHKTLQFTPALPAPGADDNASAVIALLSLARAMSKTPHDRTLRFVLFDYEEIFFLGSYAYAKELSSGHAVGMHPGEREDGLINLEMIGWSKKPIEKNPVFKIYTRRGPKNSIPTAQKAVTIPTGGAQPPEPVAPSGNPDDLHLANTVVQYAELLKSPLKPVVLSNGFDRSDNWSFWQWSFPAICISEDWEKDFNEEHYHTPTDTSDTLNFNYLSEITRAVGGAIQVLSHGNI